MVSENATAPPALPEPATPAPTKAERLKAERAAAAAAGKCSACTVREPKPGCRQCAVCLASAAKSAKKSRELAKAAKTAAKAAGPVVAKVEPAAPVTVSSVFEPFAAQLRAIDWRDPVKREAEVGAIFGQMFVAVALAPSLTDADRERLQWLQSLARQMVAFRDASAIEAARRALSGEDEPKPEDTDGPGLEPTIVEVGTSGPDNSEADGERTKQTFRGRPRARAFS